MIDGGRRVGGVSPDEPPLKAGEFVLGYRDEMGRFPRRHARRCSPKRDLCGLPQAAPEGRGVPPVPEGERQGAEDEELLAAKMMGRWCSGAPRALCPLHEDPALGDDDARNNALPVPRRRPDRRANPRDSAVAGVVRLHRMIRRGSAYGSMLPEGVTEDDGIGGLATRGHAGACGGHDLLEANHPA